jgi:hypothetical protein
MILVFTVFVPLKIILISLEREDLRTRNTKIPFETEQSLKGDFVWYLFQSSDILHKIS